LAGRSSRPGPVSAAAGLVDPRGVADAAAARAAGLRACGWWATGRAGRLQWVAGARRKWRDASGACPPQALDRQSAKPRKPCAGVRAYYLAIGAGSGSLR
jgi:hypothetical protein